MNGSANDAFRTGLTNIPAGTADPPAPADPLAAPDAAAEACPVASPDAAAEAGPPGRPDEVPVPGACEPAELPHPPATATTATRTASRRGQDGRRVLIVTRGSREARRGAPLRSSRCRRSTDGAVAPSPDGQPGRRAG